MSVRRSTLLNFLPSIGNQRESKSPGIIIRPTKTFIENKNKSQSSNTTRDISINLDKSNKNQIEFKEINDFESQFDNFVESIQTNSIFYSLNQFLNSIFQSKKYILWIYSSENNTLYSPLQNKIIKNQKSILHFIINNNSEVLYISPLSSHELFEKNINNLIFNSNSNILFLPIFGSENKIFFIYQVEIENIINLNEIKLISNKLFNKFKLFGELLFINKNILSMTLDFKYSNNSPIFIFNTLKKFFLCKEINFFIYNQINNQYKFISSNNNNNFFEIISINQIGTAYQCFEDLKIHNYKNILESKYYNSNIDGLLPECFLAIPYKDKLNQIWVCCLKGLTNKKYFNYFEENLLLILLPFIIKSLSFLFLTPEYYQEFDQFETRLKALLDVAEILSGTLDIDTLLPTIMDKACLLLNAERCSLFLVDSTKNELVTRFHGGLENSIKVKIGRGIVGYCAQTGEIINIRDAYSDSRFDRSVDLSTGFTTRSLLCVPIYNNRGEINGVTEMINKKKSGLFDEDDEKMLMAFNVFCGISLDNARLYKASLDLTKQLRTFIEMSVVLSQNDIEANNLKEILNNIMSIANASRVSLFLANEIDNSLSLYLNIGNLDNFGTIFVQESASNRKFMIFDHKEVLGRTQTEQLNAAIEKILAAGLDADVLVFGKGDKDIYNEEEEEEYFFEEYSSDNNESIINQTLNSEIIRPKQQTNSKISSFIPNLGQSRLIHDSKKLPDSHEIICCLPLLSSESTILGVIEIRCSWKISNEDIKLLDSFSVFAAVSLERSRLKNQATYGQVEIELKTWIDEKERILTNQIPLKLLIGMDKLSTILMIKFDAPEWDGIGLFKVVFAIFDLFDLLNTFLITNEKLFRFLTEVKNKYNKVPYHNWRHAVDVMQFVSYQILVGSMDSIFSKLEILALLISSLCHDLDHDGFSNIYNVKAETPLGILFKNQSVMETHHCAESIMILTKEDCNLFSNLSTNDYKIMWNLIIQLILSTDMAKHFDIINQFNEINDLGNFNINNQIHRLLLLQLIIKCEIGRAHV